MTVSPVKCNRPLALSFATVLLALAVPVSVSLSIPFAAAQDAGKDFVPGIKPVPLSPPQKLAPPTASAPAPAPLLSAPSVAPAPTLVVPDPAKDPAAIGKGAPLLALPKAPTGSSPGRGSGVQVDSLQTIDPDTAGTLTAEHGGFGVDMWLGTDRAIVERLLPKLPVNASSVTMRGLMRRMLLSVARIPEGKTKTASLVAVRARLLAAMGDPVAVNTLLNATPGRAENPELVRIETETRFLANDNARACALAGGEIRGQNNPFWQKVFLFCQALAGEHDKAALGVSIMRETGEQDEVFFSLIESLAAGTPPEIKSLTEPTPLTLAMARVAKAKLPQDVISTNRPGVFRTIAISPNAPVEIRLEAAERAEAAGALPVDSLRQLYSIVSFSGEDLANPLSRAESKGGPMTRALLYHTSLTQTVPTAQAEVVARAMALGREEGRYSSVVRVFLPVLKSIPPSAELLWFAPEAVRGLLLVGETVSAESWFALMRASALFNKEAAQAITQLMPVVRLMGSSEADEWHTGKLSSWWATIKDRKGAGQDAALLYSLFDALGEPVPADAWSKLATGGERRMVSMPEAALWYRLMEATDAVSAKPEKTKTASANGVPFEVSPESGDVVPPSTTVPASAPAASALKPKSRLAETVLLALLALGDDGPAGADSLVLRQVLISLRAAGFEKEARSMSVEAVLAAGL
ncbi:MAG: hypothetical protein H8E39_06075 [Alphaproteobacteria bacterium]|nr:hypothetical protein [Alphaproteobacteria bacterium]